MVNVIVPIYKVEKYLRKCVESIQNQTYCDLKIILVDDGSPDNCGEICDELAKNDDRIFVLHQKNAGLAAARNAGIDFALTGDTERLGNYVAFVDGDDTIEPDMYQTMVNSMQNACDMVICGHRIIKEGIPASPVRLELTQYVEESFLWSEVFERLNNAVWNKLYRADLIGELRFPMGVIHGEDLIFNLNYLKRCRAGAINKTEFYNYLKRDDSITTSGFSQKKLMEIVAKDMAKELIANYCPRLLAVADKYCFRARMNVMRGIYKSNVEQEYTSQISECVEYTKKEFCHVKKNLKTEERIEYWLFRYARWGYRYIVKCLWKR